MCVCICVCVCASVLSLFRETGIRIHGAKALTSQAVLLPKKEGQHNTGPDQKEGALGLALSQAASGPWVYKHFLSSEETLSTCLEVSQVGKQSWLKKALSLAGLHILVTSRAPSERARKVALKEWMTGGRGGGWDSLEGRDLGAGVSGSRVQGRAGSRWGAGAYCLLTAQERGL